MCLLRKSLCLMDITLWQLGGWFGDECFRREWKAGTTNVEGKTGTSCWLFSIYASSPTHSGLLLFLCSVLCPQETDSLENSVSFRLGLANGRHQQETGGSGERQVGGKRGWLVWSLWISASVVDAVSFLTSFCHIHSWAVSWDALRSYLLSIPWWFMCK